MKDLRSKRLAEATEAYYRAFDRPNPEPWGVNDDVLAEALERAVRQGEAIPEDYDWWGDLPPDAVA